MRGEDINDNGELQAKDPLVDKLRKKLGRDPTPKEEKEYLRKMLGDPDESGQEFRLQQGHDAEPPEEEYIEPAEMEDDGKGFFEDWEPYTIEEARRIMRHINGNTPSAQEINNWLYDHNAPFFEAGSHMEPG